jgi:hypothetical protein
MPKKLLLIFVLIHLFVVSKSQTTFQITFGDATHDEATSVLKAGNGYVFLGSSSNPGVDSSKIIFEKLDSLGNIILASTFCLDTFKNTFGNNIKETQDGGLIICGTTFGSNIDPVSDDAILIKTDPFGNIDWAFVYGGVGSDQGYSVDVCNDGGYFVAGATTNGSGNKSGYAMKVDAAGNPVWYNSNTILNDSRFNKGSKTSDGGFIATGSTFFSSSKDLFVVKYDSSGNVKWSNRSAAAGNQEGNSIRGTSDGGCIIAGTNSTTGSVNSNDLLVVKLDSTGATQWAKTYNYLLEDVGTDIIENSNGHFIITGYTNTTDAIAPVRSMFFLDLNSSGVPVASQYYGSNTLDHLSNAIIPTNDGGFLMAGITYEYDANGDAVLVKTDASGGTHSCSIQPASFTSSAFLLTTTAGSTVNSVLPNFSNVTIIPGTFVTSFSPICFDQSVSENNDAPGFNLYPNPVQYEMTIRLNETHSFETLTILDVYGRIITRKTISTGESFIHLNTVMITPGLYEIELRGKKNVAVKKFVKVD